MIHHVRHVQHVHQHQRIIQLRHHHQRTHLQIRRRIHQRIRRRILPTPPTNPPTNPPTTPPVTPPPTITYEYEYKKSVPAGCVTWGAWSNPIVYVDADGLTFGKWAKLEVEDLGSNYEVVGYRPVTIKTTTQRIVQVGSYTETLCTEYTYVRINNTTYAVTSGGWTDAGYYEGYSAPNDTADTHYEFVRVNWDVCGDTCTNHPYLVYKVYKRTLVQKAADNSDSVSRTCSATTTRTIPLYAIQTTTETYNENNMYTVM